MASSFDKIKPEWSEYPTLFLDFSHSTVNSSTEKKKLNVPVSVGLTVLIRWQCSKTSDVIAVKLLEFRKFELISSFAKHSF